MPLPRTNRRPTISRMACAAFVAIVADEPGAEVLTLTSADGLAIETNRLSASTRLAGAFAIWLQHSYGTSIECNPPRACYAKSQVINYHFSCRPRYIVVLESFSMDLNGDIVKHEVVDPVPPIVPSWDIDHGVLNSYCGPPPDLEDLPWRRHPPEPAEKPRKGR